MLTGLYGLLRDVWAAMSLIALMTQGLIVAVLAGLSLLMRVFARGLALLRTVGALLGFAFGSAVTAVMSGIVTACTDILVAARTGWTEVQLVAGFVSLALLLALLPAILAARKSPLEDLRA